MQLRCKDGDLAIVVREFPGCEDNIGRIVRVRCPIKINDRCSLPCWLVKPISKNRYSILEFDDSISHETVRWKDRIEHPDCGLLPIRPLDPADEFLRKINDLKWNLAEESNLLVTSLDMDEPLLNIKGL
jgi:hypothetical protein